MSQKELNPDLLRLSTDAFSGIDAQWDSSYEHIDSLAKKTDSHTMLAPDSQFPPQPHRRPAYRNYGGLSVQEVGLVERFIDFAGERANLPSFTLLLLAALGYVGIESAWPYVCMTVLCGMSLLVRQKIHGNDQKKTGTGRNDLD